MDDMLDELLPPGWAAENELLICSHGAVTELDGACPSSCLSPCGPWA